MLDYEKRSRHRGVYFALNRCLAKAYLSNLWDGDQDPPVYVRKAESLVKGLQSEAKITDDTLEWAGKTLRKWELSLDLVRVFWRAGHLSKARRQFEQLAEINLIIEKGKATLPDLELSYDDQGEVRNLAIQVKREEGFLNLAAGQMNQRDKNMAMAKKSWEAARIAFLDARIAVKQWRGHDTRMFVDVNLFLAETQTKLRNKDYLDEAISSFEEELKRISEEIGSRCRRACDIECKLNAAKLGRGNRSDVDEVELSSEDLLRHNEATLGSNHDRTIECAAQLREVYVRKGEMENVKALSTKYEKLAPLETPIGGPEVRPMTEGMFVLAPLAVFLSAAVMEYII